MKKLFTLIPMLLVLLVLKAQTPNNLNFEILKDNKAKDWKLFGSKAYSGELDSVTVKSGNYSGMLTSGNENSNFKAWAYKIPAIYKSGTIKLTGYIKTENVSEGHAGLWMRLDPQVGFDNMEKRGITGTTDWKKYEIVLNMTSQTENIIVGGILSGKGKMWVDDLEVTINDKPLEKAPLKKLSIADKDSEFNNGSNITIPELNDTNLANLELLGRIWGFIKYYHPEIATGNINWDYELFRVLPNYLNVKNNTERDAVILRWIEGLDDILPCKTCNTINKKAFITPDLAWLNQSGLSKDLSSKLNYIKNNRFQGNHYYVKPAPGVGNPIFKNEKSYANIPETDQGFKLLAVYRYWNMIQYFFPYKNETDQDWNTVLAEMITKIMKTDSDIDHHLALLEMVVKIDDSHGWFTTRKLRKYFGFNTLPFQFKIIDDKVVVTELKNEELTAAEDIKIGDAIETINGTPVAKLLKDNSKYIYASNPSVKKRNAKSLIFKGDEDSVNITFERDGQVSSKTIKKYTYDALKSNLPDKKIWDILDGNIGYVNMGILTVEQVKETMEALKNTKGIVFDIRNYPKGTMYEVAKYLHTESVEFVKFTKPDYSYPGTFVWVNSYSCGGGKLKNQYKGKVVILVNETTQSHAEFTTMALQTAKDAVIIGSQTSGADGNVSTVPIVGGHSSSITGIGIYYPDGKETQRIGIVPDIKVLPTIKGIRAGIDEPLEKAIEVINSK